MCEQHSITCTAETSISQISSSAFVRPFSHATTKSRPKIKLVSGKNSSSVAKIALQWQTVADVAAYLVVVIRH